MKRFFAAVPVFLLLLLLVSCIKPEPYFKVRMSVQEIQEGAFTGGRLIYSHDERINQLRPGLLIPVKEMVKGWVKEENSNVHTYQTLSTNYGYYYIVAVDDTAITVDYLIYNEIGKILTHKENVQIGHSYVVNQSGEETGKTSTCMPSFLSMTRFTDIAGEAYTLSSSLEGAKLLSFPCERPDDSQQMAVNEDETFLSVLFRLQENATTQYDYSSGLICAHYSEPCLVINAAQWPENSYEVESNAVFLLSSDTLDIPVSPGDYLLLPPEFSEEISGTRRIVNIGMGDMFTLFTEEADLYEVTGGIDIKVSGSASQLMDMYELAKVFHIIDIEERLNVWKQQGLAIDLDFKFLLDMDLDLSCVCEWNEVSANGHFYFISDYHTFLILKLLANNTDPKANIRIPLGKSTQSIMVGPIIVYIDHEFRLIGSWQFPEFVDIEIGAGPVIKIKLGFDFDVGAKLKFALGIFPYPSLWADFDSDSYMDYGYRLITPTLPDHFPEEAQLNIGLEYAPVVRVIDYFQPYLALQLMIENNIKKVRNEWAYSLDLHPAIDFWIRYKIPWLNTSFSGDYFVGRILEDTWNLFRKNPEFVDEREKGSYSSIGSITTSPAIGEDGMIYITTDQGYLNALKYDAEMGKLKNEWSFRYPYSPLGSQYQMTSPIIDREGTVYYAEKFEAFGQSSFKGIIAVSDGKMLWKSETYNDLTALAMGAGSQEKAILFAGDSAGNIFAYSSTGYRIWERNLGSGIGISSISVTQEGTVLVVANRYGDGSVLFALDFEGYQLETQNTALEIGGLSDAGAGKIAINGDGSLRLCTGQTLWAIAPTYDRIVWKYIVGGKITSSPVIGRDERVYFGCEDGCLYCIKPDGTLAWKFDAGSKIVSTPLIGGDGHIYLATENGIAFVVAFRDILDKDGKKIAEEGKMLWRFPKNADENMGSIQGGLAMNDGGLLLVPSTNWQLYAVQTDARGLGEVPWPRYAYNSQNTSGISYIPSSLSITLKNAPHIVKMEGEKVTLEVEATGGVKPYTYQWMHGGFPVAGANGSNCTIENLEVEDEGEYYVIVRDSFRPHPKVLISNTAKIEVNSTRTGEKRWTVYDSFALSPAVDGYGYLYAISRSGTLYRLLTESGETAYVLPTKNSYGTPVIYQNHEERPILLTFNETTDRITAFEANRFDKLWEEAMYSHEFGNFGVVGDAVMAIRREMIYSLNCTDGKRGKGLFSNIIALPLEFSMTIPGNALYFGTENKEVVALYIDPVGALRWRCSTVGRVVSPIAIDSDWTIYFTDDLGRFYAIDAGGKKKWTYDLTEGKKVDLNGATASPVVSSGGLVYVAANNGKIFAFDRSGKRKWTFQANGSVYSTPVLGNDDRIYICTSSGTVHALNSITGVEEWKYSLGNYRILGSPILYEGKLLVGSEPLDEKGTGKLVAINVSSTGLDSGPWSKYRQNNMNTATIN